jgi:hypothetical protein
LIRRTVILFGVLVLAVAAWVLLFRRYDRQWQTKPMAPTQKKVSARPAKALELKRATTSGKSPAEVWAGLLKDGVPKLSAEQVEAYVEGCGRDARSLLVAKRMTGDLDYLREAALAHPEDPMVQLEVALTPAASPEERRVALDLFRALEPDNAVGDYLSAHLSFSQGDYAAAAQGLLDSLDHGALADYNGQLMDGAEQAYRESGLDPLSAQLAAMAGALRPTLTPMREVARHLDGLKDEFLKSGDLDAAEPSVRIGIDLGQKLQVQGPYLIDQLVGMGIEKNFLEQLDPLTPVGVGGLTVGERLASLEAQKNDIQTSVAAFGEAAAKMDEATSKEYFLRLRRDGELSAMKWVLSK